MSSTGLKGVNAYTCICVYIYVYFTHEKDMHLQNQNDLVNFMLHLGFCCHCFCGLSTSTLDHSSKTRQFPPSSGTVHQKRDLKTVDNFQLQGGPVLVVNGAITGYK